MLDDEAMLNAMAIGLRPAKNRVGHSQFGGHPNLSPDIQWPHDAAGRPMHHLIQLDCAALPLADPDLPRTGTLLFFIAGSYEERNAPDLTDNGADAFAVIYQDAAPSDVPVRLHPEGCPALGDRSFAISPVRHDRKVKKMGFFQRLVNTQPEPYSGSGGTGYFAAVPLETVLFDSMPATDPATMFDAFDAHDYQYAQDRGLRPVQLMGYAPTRADLTQALSEGYRTCSDEKALAALDASNGRDDVLLLQLAHEERFNLDLVSYQYALQFRISRRDLKARAFDRTIGSMEELGLDGLWTMPEPAPAPYEPQPSELVPQIGLKPLTPFETPRAKGNYFCGLPRLPETMKWPCLKNGYPLNFLMQVDCASLPRHVQIGQDTRALPEFPATGTLFIFAYDYLDEVDPESIRILYSPEDTSNVSERIPPEALKTQPEFSPYSIRNGSHDGSVARFEPRRPFEPVGFANIIRPVGGDPDFETKDTSASHFNGAFPHEENAFPGVTLLLSWLSNYTAHYFSEGGQYDSASQAHPIRHVPQSYPWRWGDIASATENFPSDSYANVQDKHRDMVFDASLIAQGKAWKIHAQACDALDRIPDAERAAYREWLIEMDACAANIPRKVPDESDADHRLRWDLRYAFRDIMRPLAHPNEHGSVPTTLYYLAYDETADDIPDDMRETVAEVVRFNRSDTQLRGYNTYHKPNPDLMFASDAEGRSTDTEVMLFSLASGAGLPVNWVDCCWLHIWIGADDLAQARFDRIRPAIKW